MKEVLRHMRTWYLVRKRRRKSNEVNKKRLIYAITKRMLTSVVSFFISEDFKRVRLYEDEGNPPPHAYVVSDVEKTEEK